MYAQWVANNYTITYDANGGKGTTQNSAHTYDQTQSLSPNGFSRTGWTFKGWSTASGGTVEYQNKETVINVTPQADGNVTLYAIWELSTSGHANLSGPYTIDHALGDAKYIFICDLRQHFDMAELIDRNKAFTITVTCTAQAKENKQETATIGFFVYEGDTINKADDAKGLHLSEAKKFTGTTSLSVTGSISATTISSNPYLYIYFSEDVVLLDHSHWVATNISLTINC